MTRQRAVGLAAAGLLAAISGCGGSDDSTGFLETRAFEFTVTVPGATGSLDEPAFFRDRDLEEPGVVLESAGNPSLAIPAAQVTGQEAVPAAGSGFSLAVHFDASGSIDDAGRDQPGNRFTAARGLVLGVAAVAPATPTRVYAFRSTYPGGFMLIAPDVFPASSSTMREQAISNVEAEKAEDNSPALTATFNIIGDGTGAGGSLPGDNHAMLLLTDGENNAESAAAVGGVFRTCLDDSERVGGCSDNTDPVAALARSRDVQIFVAGLGNNDGELAKFRRLAKDTSGAFVKVTRSEVLEAQFRNVGALMTAGGVVVSGRTAEVTVVKGGNPFVRGWMRFGRPAGGCPGPSEEVPGTSVCLIEF